MKNINEEESQIREKNCRNGISTFLSLIGYRGDDQQLEPWMIRVLNNEDEEINTTEETKKSSSTPNYLKANRLLNKKNNTNIKKINIHALQSKATPKLPEKFVSKINELGGSDLVFLIEKTLFDSDVNCGQGRFAFSTNQIVNGFLNDKEMTQKDIEVTVIDPGVRERSMKLTKWNANYVLKTNWMTVVKENGLEINMKVQLWSFRVERKLYFAMIKLEEQV